MLMLEYLIELSELISDEISLDLLELDELDEMEELRLDSLDIVLESNEDCSYPERKDEFELGILSELKRLSVSSEFCLTSGFVLFSGFFSDFFDLFLFDLFYS